VNSRHAEQGVFDSPRNAFVHGTAGSGERHRDVDIASVEFDAVDQAEVHDVATDFGIDHLAEGLEQHLFLLFGLSHKVAVTILGNGLSRGRKKCARMRHMFMAKTASATAKSAQPQRTIAARENSIPASAVKRPARKIQ